MKFCVSSRENALIYCRDILLPVSFDLNIEYHTNNCSKSQTLNILTMNI